MAFQRPFLISLKRGDPSMRWGFGINGGREYGQPLRIHSIAEDSIAERCGLHEGDEIIQVGRVNVQDLTQSQAYEVLARCGNKIEMFVVREDWLSQKKGKDPPVVKAVVHNPYNSPLGLYSTENVAETLAKQTEVLTEGHVSTEEEEGPENLSFREKSAVFKLLEEQAIQESTQKSYPRGGSNTQVVKPKSAPPPPPKPKPPAGEHLHNGYDASYRQQLYEDQQNSTSRYEYQTSQQVVNQHHYRQEQPVQLSQTSVYQTSYQNSPGFHSPVAVEKSYSPGYQSPGSAYQSRSQQQIYQQSNYQSAQGPQSPTGSHQQRNASTYQQAYYQPSPQSPVSTYQQQSSYQQVSQSPAASSYPQHPGYQAQSASNYQQNSYQQASQSPAVSYQQHPGYQSQSASSYQSDNQIQSSQSAYNQQNKAYQQGRAPSSQSQAQYQGIPQSARGQKFPTAVSKAEFKIGPPPPPRASSAKQQQQDSDSMAAVYKQQYEQHLQQYYEQEQGQANHVNGDVSAPKAHIIKDNIFENDSTPGAPITYKAPPVAPPKPHWPPPPSSEHFQSPAPPSPTGMNVSSVWPPKKSTVTELPKTGFNPAAVREQGTGRRCVWPPPGDDHRGSGRNTPQSPVSGRRIQWNPSPSPPVNRRSVFGASQSPVRRKDIQWPPPAAQRPSNKENCPVQSPRLSRKARFDDYVKEHASVNVPQTYRPPPGTQHVEFY